MAHEKYDNTALNSMAIEISKMRYDDMSYLLGTLADLISNDADVDRIDGKRKLAKICESASVLISQASQDIEEAWKISEPHMKDEI